MRPNTRQLWVLLALTLVWSLNWPIMKAGVSGLPGAPQTYPPLAFRALSMWLGLPVLGAALVMLKVPFRVPLQHWREVAVLTLMNMVLWHVVVIIGVQQLSSGRSAILGYTMPVPLLTIVFWMTTFTAVLMALLSTVFESPQWRAPEPHVWWAIAYNAVGVFGFAHAAWFYLARTLPPVASSISVMMIPVLGVFSGAWLLGEVLHWQDWVAMASIVVAIALVLFRR